MELNAPAPDFLLFDLDGVPHRLGDYRGKIVVVNFWSAECPWSERADRNLLEILRQVPGRVAVLPVAANATEPDEMLRAALLQRGLDFVLRDSGGSLAAAWGAATTPHVFVVDSGGVLRYRGAVDDVTFRKRTPERFYVQEALEALLEGRLPAVQETSPYGCTIVTAL